MNPGFLFAKAKGYDMCTLGGKPTRVIDGTGFIGKAGKYAPVAVAVQTLLPEGDLGVSRNASHNLTREFLYKLGLIGVRGRGGWPATEQTATLRTVPPTGAVARS